MNEPLRPIGEPPCRIGLWGRFEARSCGDALVGHILRHQLAQRLPGVQIRTAAPDRFAVPGPHDGGEPVEALGAWSPERAAELTADLDCIVVADVDLLTDRFFLEGGGPSCPLVWHAVALGADPTAEQAELLRAAAARAAHITVRDEASRRRLGAAGVERSIGIAADVSLLTSRLSSPGLLTKRLDYLRAMRWYPPAGAPLVVESGAHLLPYVAELGSTLATLLESRPGLHVVLAEMGSPADAEITGKLAEQLPPGSVTRLPPEAGMEDVAAAIAASGAFAAATERSALAARSLGRTAAVVHRPEDLADLLGAAQTGTSPAGTLAGTLVGPTKEAEMELDDIAGVVREAAQSSGRQPDVSDADRLADLSERLARAEAAHEARSRRHAVERSVFADYVNQASKEIADLKAEIARMKEEYKTQVELWQDHHREEAALRARAEAEITALRATRTFRYSSELRGAYGKIRRRIDPPSGRRSP